LELTTILVFPVFYQIDQYVDTPLQVHLMMMIEVGMHRKMPALSNLVESSAGEIRIRNQAIDSSNILYYLDERKRIENIEQSANFWLQRVRMVAALEAFLCAVECFVQ